MVYKEKVSCFTSKYINIQRYKDSKEENWQFAIGRNSCISGKFNYSKIQLYKYTMRRRQRQVAEYYLKMS